MIGNVSIDDGVLDISLENIWRSWYRFRKGKRRTSEFERFTYTLEQNLFALWQDISKGAYRHGSYRNFIVNDTKRRVISVAQIRDRIVHRLLYDYLNNIYDKTFIFDAWSCRKNKGLIAAISRIQGFMKSNQRGFLWRADIRKFFDNVDQDVLRALLQRNVPDTRAISLLNEVITGFPNDAAKRERERERVEGSAEKHKGIPIGNLTSQICANIYLHEFDRYVVHTLKPSAYARYGDDFIMFEKTFPKLETKQIAAVTFLHEKLGLAINDKNEILSKVLYGVHMLGVYLYPKGRRLDHRARRRTVTRLSAANFGSYYGLVRAHENMKYIKRHSWRSMNYL